MLRDDFKTYVISKVSMRASWLLIEGVRGSYTQRGIRIVFGHVKESLIKEVNDTIRPYLTTQDYEMLMDFIEDQVTFTSNLTVEQLGGIL